MPPENPLRKRDVFFEKVGRFVAKRGNFFVFVAHFSIALPEFASPPLLSNRIVPHFSTFRLALSIFTFTRRGVFISRTRPYTHVAIAYAHFTEFRFCVFTLHLASNYFVMSVLR